MPSRRKPKEPAFLRSAIEAALQAARVPEGQRQAVMNRLDASKPKLGRKRIDIEEDLLEAVKRRVDAEEEGKKMSKGTAARLTADKYPESLKMSRRRLITKRLDEVYVDEDKMTLEEIRGLREEVRALKKQLAEKVSGT